MFCLQSAPSGYFNDWRPTCRSHITQRRRTVECFFSMRWDFQSLFSLYTFVRKKEKKNIGPSFSRSPGEHFPGRKIDNDREQPLRLWKTRCRQDTKHLLRYCNVCPAKKKKRLCEESAAKENRRGPSRSTCSQTGQQSSHQKTHKPPSKTIELLR